MATIPPHIQLVITYFLFLYLALLFKFREHDWMKGMSVQHKSGSMSSPLFVFREATGGRRAKVSSGVAWIAACSKLSFTEQRE